MNEWTRRMLRAAVVVAVASGPASHAVTIIPISQERTVTAEASWNVSNETDTASAEEEATDYGLFDEFVVAKVQLCSRLGCPVAWGKGSANQNSEIGLTALAAEGSASASAEGNHFEASGAAHSNSRFQVTFLLSAPSPYSLQGELERQLCCSDGVVVVTLSDEFGVLSTWQVNGAPGVLLIDESGFLPAGEYTLEIEADADGYGNFQVFEEARVLYSVLFSLDFPGVGGEVPDGDDIWPGQPLVVDRLDDGMVRLNWGLSCRLDDTDYAVYVGEIGEPASLVPVACSTGGERELDLLMHDGTFFLIVPHDGSTEGSYGDRGDGTERPASVTPCYPQLLGAPICPM